MIFARQIIVSVHTARIPTAQNFHDQKTFNKTGNVRIT